MGKSQHLVEVNTVFKRVHFKIGRSMMEGWVKEKLEDLSEMIVDCEHKTAPTQDTGFPSIRTPNIGKGRLVLDGVRRVSQETYDIFTRRAKPEHPDLILAREAPLGNVAILPKGLNVCLGQRTVLIRPNEAKVSPQFLCYRILSKEVQHTMHSRGGGSTVPHLNVREIRNLPISIPPLPTQRKIAAILSAYDDLIENNLKLIKLLEEKAQLTYEEWFVRMKFPGHETTPINRETGLPKGWEKKSFSEISNINPKTSIKKGVTAPYVPMGSISETSMIISPIEERAASGGTKFKNGDTLFARITPCLENGKTGFVQFLENDNQVATGSTEFIVLRETESCGKYFNYCTSREEKFRQLAIQSMVGSDGRQRVKPSCFDKYILNQAPNRIRKQFEGYADPLFKSVQNKLKQNHLLKEARDILLPRLMMGVIDVKGVELETTIEHG